MIERALVLAPHTDDGEFGCGGTIARLVEQGTEVHYVAFSTGPVAEAKLLDLEVRSARSLLDIKWLDVHDFPVRNFDIHRQAILDLLIDIAKDWEPDFVLMPSSCDVHQDHQVVAAEGLRAFKHTTLLGYELPWNNYRFSYQAFVTLEESHVLLKIAAINCYQSQAERTYADADYIRGALRAHGVRAGSQWAEAFEVYRIVA